MKKIRAFIFARAGSKGIPNKNLLKIQEIPIVVKSILIAKEIHEIDKIYVSTDSEEISRLSEINQVEVIKRPDKLATDTSPEWLSWQHAIEYSRKKHGDFDVFISLPPTAPLRKIDDVETCLKAFTKDIDIVISTTNTHHNPWFNMVTIDSSGLAKLVMKDSSIYRRQDAPSCFDITTVAYIGRPDFIISSKGIWDGKVAAVEIPFERSIDIDSPIDFAIARFLMENPNKYGEIST